MRDQARVINSGGEREGARGPERSGPSLSPLEVEVIDLFVSAVKLMGIPRSIGEIYGLLFMSARPLPLDEVVERLRISKGSASQGIRFLRSRGALRPVYVPGERRDHFEAVVELKALAAGFLREEVAPHLESGEIRLRRLEALADEAATSTEDETLMRERLAKLGQWHRRARRLIPLLNRFLSKT